MPDDYTLRDPDGNEHVVGNASDRARLLALGYTDITDEATTPAPADKPKADRPKTATAAGTQVRDDSK